MQDKLENFQPVCSTEEVPQQLPLRVVFNGRGVLIVRDGDEFRAVDEICPHENQSMRYGVIFDGELICPHHQYRFDLKTGRCNRRCAPVQTYQTRVVDGQVWLAV